MKIKARHNWLRLLGIALFAFLLYQIDLAEFRRILFTVSLDFVAIAMLLNIPQIGLKAFRWKYLLRAQHIEYPFSQAAMSYFGSIFIGLLTPGRLGEFVKAFHVSNDCDLSLARSLSSVLLDRIFDLYALMAIGAVALLALRPHDLIVLNLVGLVFALVTPLALLLNEKIFNWFCSMGQKLGNIGKKIFNPTSWLWEIRSGFQMLTMPQVLLAGLLTLAAYGVFYSQCYLLALALRLYVSFETVSYAVSLGSLVTLLPISISGLGTREAAIVAYLGQAGISKEAAVSFSLLVFTTFYIAGGLLGAGAWWLKPAPINDWKSIEG